jgi:hypothetical protein
LRSVLIINEKIYKQLKMATKSTYIRDLPKKQVQINPVPNIENQQMNKPPEDEIVMQEVLKEIEQETQMKSMQQPTIQQSTVQPTISQPMEQNTTTDVLQQQMLQQQLLQQQMLQQQLLQQSLNQNSSSSVIPTKLFKTLYNIFLKDNIIFVLIIILYLLFENINVLSVLKIDKFSFVNSTPLLPGILRAILFSTITIVLKTLI